MADINNLENWSGPYMSRADAIEGIRLLCGSGYDALLWAKGKRWFINDAIDPDTGKFWTKMPKGGISSFVRIW